MKTLYIECAMGAAGDMLMGALYEICGQKELFLNTMNTLFDTYHITVSAVRAVKCGISGTHMHVAVSGHEESEHLHEHSHEHSHTHDSEHIHTHDPEHMNSHVHADYNSILEKIHTLPISAEVKEHAAAIYRLIGEAEARVHGSDPEQIHFHEVGTLDALADVVGCALLIHLLAPDEILCSPIHVGSGTVCCAHGTLPVPAPATAEILKGIPCYGGAVSGELCTPTGAAILKHYASGFSSMPPLMTDTIGYGMGNKDFETANCVRIFLGENLTGNESFAFGHSGNPQNTAENSFPCDDSILSISCNIDDMTGEALGLATEILMAAGALDVYTIPIQMKKNRPGILLTCLCKKEEKDKFTGLFFLHTSTQGVRYQLFDRAKLASTFETRPTAYGNIRIKKSTGYGIKKEKLEFEDLKSVVFKNKSSVSLEDVKKSVYRSPDVSNNPK